jgi:hypothetical protein
MKKYKELRKQLNEGELTDGGALGAFPDARGMRSAFSDYGIHRLENEEQVKRLKAFLNAFTGREYLEPRAALSLLRVKLNLAGLDFEFNSKTDLKANTPMIFKLNRFGGTFGTTPTHDLNQGFETTDGFAGGGMALIIKILDSQSGLYTLDINLTSHNHSSEQGPETPIKLENM